MTYRELLNLFKNNELNESDRKALEADIEKHEAIGDYLMEQSEMPELNALGEIDEGTADDKADDFEKQINAYIRKAFMKSGAIVGAIILALVLFVIFGLPKLVDCFYYDPSEIVGKTEYSETNRMSMDLAVYTELFLPGNYRDNVAVDSDGYGNYNVTIYQHTSYNDIFTDVVGKLSRGDLTLYNPNVLKRPTGNAFWPHMAGVEGHFEGEGAAGSPKHAFKELQRLSDSEKYIAYVTLDKVMNYDEFLAWCKKSEIDPNWCVMCVESQYGDPEYKYQELGYGTGFILKSSCWQLAFDKDKYPYLSVFSLSETNGFNAPRHEDMKKHVASILRYTADNPKFTTMMGADISRNDFYRAADEVLEQGIFTYGFTMIGEKTDLLRLDGMDHVAYVYTNPVQ